MTEFEELTGVPEHTETGEVSDAAIWKIRTAARVLHASESLALMLEDANYHSLQDDLMDFTTRDAFEHYNGGVRDYFDELEQAEAEESDSYAGRTLDE